MPIDASSDPYDATPGLDPASTKVNVDDVDDVADSKLDDDPDLKSFDDDLEAAGTGARTVDLDLGGIDKSGAVADDATTGKGDFDVDLDDAGNGAKLDPSLDDDGPVGKGLGSALDEIDDLDDPASKDLDPEPDADGPELKDFDVDDPDDLDGAGVKGLVGVDLHHDDDLGPDELHDVHDHDHDLDHDVKDHDLFDL